ncbi:MAG: endonuclease/exonuclease/phosphatase family protein [Longimicrobiales bacterium]|nr:endonuclease/exonuclease/phosphatase family protein [Longimicrobiales bacterium]
MWRERPPFARILGHLLLAFVLLSVAWWFVGRVTADSRRLEVRRVAVEATIEGTGRPGARGAGEPADSVARLRILAWNIAHGRGDVGPGLFRNFRGGDEETRLLRLMRIARVIRDADPDVVILNEVDFQSSWSGGVNQAEILARATGFEVWVEQRNYDLQLPFGVLEFGNALLSGVPLDTAVWVDIPPHRWIEAVTVGAKAASLVRLDGRVGPLSVIPVHLEVRGAETRLGAAAAFREVGSRESAPLILAGDFNSAPPTWPQTGDREGMAPVDRSAVGELLDHGWQSFRARRGPGPEQWTYPVPESDRAIDWVLVEPPLRVLEARVVQGTEGLSDHAPVLAVVRISPSLEG